VIVVDRSYFRLVAPPLEPEVVGLFPGTRCMVPQPFAAGGNRSYLEFWVIISSPRYPGYITPIVAHEPSVERVVGTSHSMGGGGQNRISYGTVGTSVRFNGEIVGLKPP
jgi:hypothetical protein